MTFLDTNYILRWFLNDVHEQAKIATALLEDSQPDSLLVDRVNIGEVTYVLRSQGYNHHQIAQIFDELYARSSVAAPAETDRLALEIYRITNLDFEDCLLAALHKTTGHKVATFDKALQKQLSTILL